jgi:hydrogenase-4 membrane subunit HyfE
MKMGMELTPGIVISAVVAALGAFMYGMICLYEQYKGR